MRHASCFARCALLLCALHSGVWSQDQCPMYAECQCACNCGYNQSDCHFSARGTETFRVSTTLPPNWNGCDPKPAFQSAADAWKTSPHINGTALFEMPQFQVLDC